MKLEDAYIDLLKEVEELRKVNLVIKVCNQMYLKEIGELKEDVEKYRNEIIDLRGKAHLSCPNCFDDCMGWVVDGTPCRKDWKIK